MCVCVCVCVCVSSRFLFTLVLRSPIPSNDVMRFRALALSTREFLSPFVLTETEASRIGSEEKRTQLQVQLQELFFAKPKAKLKS